MKKPTILRRRYIPYETVDITRDELIYRDENLLITRWDAIKPRQDFSGGISYAFLNEGFKAGRFYDNEGRFLYWYCDIIDVQYDEENDIYTLIDLLVDIKLMPDGAVRVLDADELAQALEQKLITTEQACNALKSLDKVLKMIYDGKFPPDICKEEQYWIK